MLNANVRQRLKGTSVHISTTKLLLTIGAVPWTQDVLLVFCLFLLCSFQIGQQWFWLDGEELDPDEKQWQENHLPNATSTRCAVLSGVDGRLAAIRCNDPAYVLCENGEMKIFCQISD